MPIRIMPGEVTPTLFVGLGGSGGRAVGRIVKPHDIEDIVQETFVRSFEAAGKSAIRHPRSFMFKTARNLALNHVTRAESRLTDAVEDFRDWDVLPSTEPLESSYEARERFLLFCSAVRELPVQCRRAFLLKKVYGLSQQEIASYLGISQSTVEKHIAKGMLICVEYMKEADATSVPPARSGIFAFTPTIGKGCSHRPPSAPAADIRGWPLRSTPDPSAGLPTPPAWLPAAVGPSTSEA